ncbi:MAG: type ISP restriction/modification enzyme [Verrucomicrobiota bacterium]|jgi:hypothetical protein
MPTIDTDQLRSIKTFPSLVKYLRDELDWPIDPGNVDDLTFEYSPEELGFDPKHAVKIREIKQLRPLVTGQPWGIFWVSFEKKKLPMVVLRRILGKLIAKSRATADSASRPTWHLHDLLFISSYGEEEHRNISFAHFSELGDGQLPVLRVLGWDDQNSIMNLDRVATRLRSCLRWPQTAGDLAMWRVRWSGAFTERYGEPIESAEALIARLAEVASGIRKRALAVLEAETDRGPMRKLFTAVRGLLIHDMSEDQFADMYAQTVSYGLLSASFSRPAGINPENLIQLTKITNPFLENLLEGLFSLNRGRFHFDVDEVGINDVLDLLRATNIEAIKAAFNDLSPSEDPVIRFYEGFLKAYDSEQRIKRGVFFTPRPVVSYIVRSVHELLQTEFGLEDGLASTATWANVAAQMERRRVLAQQEGAVAVPAFEIPKGASPDGPFVLILDIATGTATFLNECIEVIERTMKTKWAREFGKPNPESPRAWRDPEILVRWRDYVPNHLLPRLYGFEIMMAPYAIAHVKLALKLGETGYQFRDGDSLHVYLTNTLEPLSDIADAKLADLFGPLAREAQEVNNVKRTKRFTVLMGNPPYSQAKGRGAFVNCAVFDRYRSHVADERRSGPLSNDYVRFMATAQQAVETAGAGILGMITSSSFLESIVHRGMRYELLRLAPLYCLDLHGESLPGRARERENVSGPTNVFDIQEGVVVTIGVQSQTGKPSGVLLHHEIKGGRQHKYSVLMDNSISTFPWCMFRPSKSTGFLFSTFGSADMSGLDGVAFSNIFARCTTGITTFRDHFAVAFSRDEILRRMREAIALANSPSEFAKRFELANGRGLDIPSFLETLCNKGLDPTEVRGYLFAPLDHRFIWYRSDLLGAPRTEVAVHMLNRNIAMMTTRQTKEPFAAIATRLLAGHKCIAKYEGTYFAPLYASGSKDISQRALFGNKIAKHNFRDEFLEILAQRLSLERTQDGLPSGLSPEDIFQYAYAVFYSPEYRRRYAEYLKIDFPRLPLTCNLELFRALGRLGGELVALHLLESPQLDEPLTEYVGGRSPEVEAISWSKNTVWLDKAQTSGFKGVCEDVWNFPIGGYQVCEKWLKDRKGRALSAADRTHYQKIVVALHETIRIMADIDRVIEKHGGWPLK